MARVKKGMAVLSVALVALCASAAAMVAAPAGAVADPALHVTTSIPDYVTPEKGIQVFVSVQNTTTSPLNGNVTVKYTFPVGVTPAEPDTSFGRPYFANWSCSIVGQVEECVVDATGLPPGGQFRYKIGAFVEAGVTGPLTGSIEVFGGGTPDDVTVPWRMLAEPIGPFDVKTFDIGLTDGTVPSTQAGADPGEIATDIAFHSQAVEELDAPALNFFSTAPPESFKDVVVHVPAGLVGNPTATPVRCDPSQLTTPVPGTVMAQCPFGSQIGVVELSYGDIVPLYNIKPPVGSPAEFGFLYQSIVVTLLPKLNPDGTIDVVTKNAPSTIPIPEITVTLWGVPSDSSHDPLRGICLMNGFGNDGNNCSLAENERSTVPFLRMPTSCTSERLSWGLEVDTYQQPGHWVPGSTTTPAVDGCGKVPFAPGFSLAPSTLAPHSASGADVSVSMPQDAGSNGVAQADVNSASVTLPAGMSLNPSSANGLVACTDTQLRLGLEGASECPGASKIGTVTVKTPLLDHEVGGSVFLRTQNSNDPASGEMFRVAIEIRSDQDGVDIKLPGMVKLDATSGQVTTVFANLPQLPFEAMSLHFEGGSHPVLVTPEACGTYATSATLTGWNGKTVTQESPFTLGGECAPRGFAPGFTAGVGNPVAGAFTPFALQLTRSDNDQELASLSSVTLPPGLLADIGSVPRCSDSQVAAANCPAATRLGNVTVGSGSGATPVYITDGNVYLTGPYKGAPFGLAFIIHAQAGPFDLGMVTVRAALSIDPHTAQPQIVTDPLPTIVKGVPVRLRDVRVNIDRPRFMLNPTNCKTMSVNGTATSTQGASAAVSSRFQVGECRSLAFKPSFAASTSSKHSRQNGASLHVVVKSGSGQANIGKVNVQVPAAFAVRDSTLNQACTEAVFNANPAACPAGSVVGTATAYTPILGVPLTGPAIFVSHGGLEFPDLDIVLQGEGVTIILTGRTFVSKQGRLLSRFETVPDAPVSRFDLVMPAGPHSALSANGNLCTTKVGKRRVRRTLTMPTTIVGQNGAVIHQSTKVAVSGCGKIKKSAGRRK